MSLLRWIILAWAFWVIIRWVMRVTGLAVNPQDSERMSSSAGSSGKGRNNKPPVKSRLDRIEDAEYEDITESEKSKPRDSAS